MIFSVFGYYIGLVSGLFTTEYTRLFYEKVGLNIFKIHFDLMDVSVLSENYHIVFGS